MRIALVTPWFGRELIGGAERHAWELAHALAAAGASVDVLATCCRSFNDDWATDFHRAGTTQLAERLQLIRFKVDSRDRVAFNRVTSALTAIPDVVLRGDVVPLEARDGETFVRENINSRALQAYVVANVDRYDAVLFIPYLYGTTLSILPRVAHKAYLIPCLHDEAYAYLEPVRDAFAKARGLLFISAGEEETAAAIYGPAVYAKSRVVGGAVDPIAPPRGTIRIKGFTPQHARYVLYLGRQVATKNVDVLVDAYRQYRSRQSSTALQLVLAGPTSVSRSGDGIVDLGPVNAEAKAALLTYARALAQPSLHESFSRTMYESWFARRPVVVHRRCRATARAVEDSGGGWTATTVDEWSRALADIDQSADDAIDAVGERGWAAALENGGWPAVVRRVLDGLESTAASTRGTGVKLDQSVPLGDRTMGPYVAALHAALRDAGCDSEIVVSEAATARSDAQTVAHVADAEMPRAADAYVVHDGNAGVADRAVPVFAVSPNIAHQLDRRGIPAAVLPMPVPIGRWSGLRPADAPWRSGGPVVLSLASLDAADVRNLIDVFVAFLGDNRTARLLVFATDCTGDALATFEHERRELDLEREVVLVGDDIREQYAAYRAASVGIVLGTAVDVERLVTAHWFDIPVLGVGAHAQLDAIEMAGLAETAFDVHRCVAILRLIVRDERLRSAMIEEGRRAARRHAPEAVVATLLDTLVRSPQQRPSAFVDAPLRVRGD